LKDNVILAQRALTTPATRTRDTGRGQATP